MTEEKKEVRISEKTGAPVKEYNYKTTREDGKKPTGRPLLFETPEALKEKIDAYFDSCFKKTRVKEYQFSEEGEPIIGNDGLQTYKYVKVIKRIEVPTIIGLAVALKTDRVTLLNYERKIPEEEDRTKWTETDKKNYEYFNIIKEAKTFCEYHTNKAMFDGTSNPTACIFNLKANHKWRDAISIEGGDEDKPLGVVVLPNKKN